MVTKAKLLPNLSQAFVGKLSEVLLLTSVGILTASPGWAVVVAPTSITVSVPAGSNNAQADGSTQTYSLPATAPISAANTYVDDVLLQSITFSGTTFTSTNLLRDTQRFEVTAGRANINAEYGQGGTTASYIGGTATITDTNSDTNPNPFVSSGSSTEGTYVPAATRESVNPIIQDAALQAAFNSLSISQGIDGELLTNAYTYRTIFDQGVVDSSTILDDVPELIFFERGLNSNYTVRAITGGTFANPTFAGNTVTLLQTQHTASGIFIDTVEINAGQQLGIVGIDLNEFGITAANTAIYGIELTSTDGNNAGADIYGQFASASNTANFRTVPSNLAAVPEPLTILGSGMALGFGALMKRQHSRKRKETT